MGALRNVITKYKRVGGMKISIKVKRDTTLQQNLGGTRLSRRRGCNEKKSLRLYSVQYGCVEYPYI